MKPQVLILFASFGFLAAVSVQERDGKFFPFGIFSKSKKGSIAEECYEEYHAKIVGGQCVRKYDDVELHFEAARKYCKARGGDMWLPNLYNPYIYAVLFTEFPEVVTHQNFWIPVKARGSLIYDVRSQHTFNGIPWFAGITINNNAICIKMDLSDGIPEFSTNSCTADARNPICEFPLTANKHEYEKEIAIDNSHGGGYSHGGGGHGGGGHGGYSH